MDLAAQVQEGDEQEEQTEKQITVGVQTPGNSEETGLVSQLTDTVTQLNITPTHSNIQFKTGDIFDTPESEPIAHCINADCSLGAGIAKQIRERYGVFKIKQQRKQPGQCAVTREGDRIVFHLVTKFWCTDLPSYSTLTESLIEMREWCVENGVKSVSVPRLGCGLDKLEFKEVVKILGEVFEGTEIRITVYSLLK